MNTFLNIVMLFGYLLVVPIRNSGIFGKEVINILFNVKMKLKLSIISIDK